jgi:hypothetical protein
MSSAATWCLGSAQKRRSRKISPARLRRGGSVGRRQRARAGHPGRFGPVGTPESDTRISGRPGRSVGDTQTELNFALPSTPHSRGLHYPPGSERALRSPSGTHASGVGCGLARPGLLAEIEAGFSSTVHTVYLAAGGRKGSDGKLSTRAVEWRVRRRRGAHLRRVWRRKATALRRPL